MEMTSLLIAALAPAAVLLYYIYRKDKYQKEPVKEILKAFGWGVGSVFVTLIIANPLTNFFGISSDPTTIMEAVAVSFIGAAIPEEIAKFLMFWLFIRRSKCFDEKMDGIVYASCVSLGFAALENILYLVSNYDSWVSVGITRALFSVPGHFFFGVLMGYYYSLYRFFPSENPSYKWLILGAPILAHGLFDTILFSGSAIPTLALITVIPFIIFCNSLRKRASRSIAEHLERDKKDRDSLDSVIE